MSERRADRKNEVSFCADVKSWADALFAQHAEWPFAEAHIEEYGPTGNRRQDLRIHDRDHRTPILIGEVKMPGTLEGRNPYGEKLVKDASSKADDCQAKYFFTWNVNTFVLFDRSQWNKPLPERRVKQWDLDLGVTDSGQCTREDVKARIRDQFLPEFFEFFAGIVTGRVRDWAMPPDVVFLRSLESHLDWPAKETCLYLGARCSGDADFRAQFERWLVEDMQWTFDPDDRENWQQTLDRAARTLCYVFSNRAIFYHAVRARYPAELMPLALPHGKSDPEDIYEYFRRRFRDAVDATGDYEPIFYPEVNDWAGALVFASSAAREGWKGVFANLDDYNFQSIPRDIVGGIFQGLIAPEERQRFGQFFTHEDIVDVINAFCIRRAGDVVLDPACGSGSFLVRAYHRKAWLGRHRGGGRRNKDADKTHQELLREIFGCDIALFPAHLATLNLAARQIEDEENYPLIRRGNFFEVIERPEQFASIPVPGRGEPRRLAPMALPALDAIVGNPPYVRQELIPKRSSIKPAKGESKEALTSRRKNTKEHFQELVSAAWCGLKLSGRSDLHCYFWPVAAQRLKEGGYFGFLTSSSWLDVEYGFALQAWILRHFKLIAVIESVDEPWFEDARVKTCVTILQRTSDATARDENLVKFVRLQKPLADILGPRAHGDESARQKAAMNLRALIESTREERYEDRFRIIPVRQADLWREGVAAGRVLGHLDPNQETGQGDEQDAKAGQSQNPPAELCAEPGEYVAGKWGRFLRAPDLYFRLIREYGHRFVRLGEIAEVRFGVKSGCDAFFMPRDVTTRILEEVRGGALWLNVPLMTACSLRDVARR